MSVERQRSRTVTALVLASLAQDTFLLFTSTAFGLAKFFDSLGHSLHNFSRTFAFLFNDQQAKYEALTGRSFAGHQLGQGDDDDDE